MRRYAMLDMAQELCNEAIITEHVPHSELTPCGRYHTGPRWHCVRTGYDAEIIADIELRTSGFTVFNPSIWKPATKPRRDANGVVRPGKPDRIEPMFKRYLFVRFALTDNWGVILRTRGVEFLFRSAGPNQHGLVPTPVPDQAIAAIRSQLMPNDCWYPPDHCTQPLAINSRAKATIAGTDIAGIVKWSDGQRVRLLMEIMGRPVTVTVQQAAVEVV